MLLIKVEILELELACVCARCHDFGNFWLFSLFFISFFKGKKSSTLRCLRRLRKLYCVLPWRQIWDKRNVSLLKNSNMCQRVWVERSFVTSPQAAIQRAWVWYAKRDVNACECCQKKEIKFLEFSLLHTQKWGEGSSGEEFVLCWLTAVLFVR